MIEHHIQKKIIAKLVESETVRYSDLKPENIDGNVFTYHLQSLLKQHFIEKSEKGKYKLTNKGKLYGINISLTIKDALKQAHSIILLSIKDDNKWLLRKRLVQPMFGRIGFIHGEPIAGESIYEAADRILFKRTELNGKCNVKGSGYITLTDKEDIIAYSHFTLVEVSKLQGTLKKSDSHGENMWTEEPDFSDSEMIPSMKDFSEKLEQTGLFFIDKTYRI
jgi:hypothetical protein